MRELLPSDRLIVAADFRPDLRMREGDKTWVRLQVLELAEKLKGLGVYLKVNSALRCCGYSLLDDIRGMGLRTFADLKLYDIGETLSIDGALLKRYHPDILTVSCNTGDLAMKALKDELPDTEILGVTVLTSIGDHEADFIHRYGNALNAVKFLAAKASGAGMDGIICSPKEAAAVRYLIREKMTINTPNIRPAWAQVSGDDQNPNRAMTPAEAMKVGVTRIVLGRPITQAESPREAVKRTLEEIGSVLSV